jgi:aspartate aminotransferase/aminotransferase
MLTPSGHPKSYNLTMLLYQWALHLKQKGKSVIMAGIGKPTYPISLEFAQAQQQFWANMSQKSELARQHLDGDNGLDPDAINAIASIDATADYGDPQGDFSARAQVALILKREFKNALKVEADNVLFTVGGTNALYSMFKIIDQQHANGILVTSFPYYALYSGPNNENQLYPIAVMDAPGYRLTAQLLEQTLTAAQAEATRQQTVLSAFILCNPNNPLGTVLNKQELAAIAVVLRKYPQMMIILDEVYGEMSFTNDPCISLLQVAPDLKERILLMRSATKAMSAAGERAAIVVTFNKEIMGKMITEMVNTIGHAPRSSQMAFAHAMAKINDTELRNIRRYYEPQVRYVEQRLRLMGAAMPDPRYRVEGGFYVVADLSELLGMDIPPEAARALNKIGPAQTDAEIAFSLLFQDHIMIAPLSQSGIDAKKCYFRITCSAGMSQLETLMDRLEKRLKQCRGNAKQKKDTMKPLHIKSERVAEQ